MVEKRIPKIIHYCWFGGNPLPELAQRCIASWEKYCPDYEIIEWNEHNFDINCNDYVKEAYEAKKWAFVSDVARLYALVHKGGFYMDTDVELLKSLDEYRNYESLSGFENETQIPTGLMACQAGSKLFVELLSEYNDIHFVRRDGSYDTTTNVKRITSTCLKYGLVLNNKKQTVNGFTLFPTEYFCPKDYRTGELNLTDNTVCIHHFNGSWVSEEDRYCLVLRRKIAKYVSAKIAYYIAKIISIIKFRGLAAAIKETFSRLGRK